MPKTIDSLTGQEFASYEEYLDHVNPVTGYTPRDLQHQGKRGIMVARKALGRTKSLSKANEAALDKNWDEVKRGGVDEKLSENKAQAITKQKTARITRLNRLTRRKR